MGAYKNWHSILKMQVGSNLFFGKNDIFFVIHHQIPIEGPLRI